MRDTAFYSSTIPFLIRMLVGVFKTSCWEHVLLDGVYLSSFNTVSSFVELYPFVKEYYLFYYLLSTFVIFFKLVGDSCTSFRPKLLCSRLLSFSKPFILSTSAYGLSYYLFFRWSFSLARYSYFLSTFYSHFYSHFCSHFYSYKMKLFSY